MQLGQPVRVHRFFEFCAPGPGRQWRIDNVFGNHIRSGMRIERVLKGGTKHHIRIIMKNIFRTVTVMHIKIENCQFLDAKVVARRGGTHRDIIENTKPHGARTLGMMPRWTHVAKGGLLFTRHDQFNAQHNCSGST